MVSDVSSKFNGTFGCFALNFNKSFPHVVHPRTQCLNLNEEHPILVH